MVGTAEMDLILPCRMRSQVRATSNLGLVNSTVPPPTSVGTVLTRRPVAWCVGRSCMITNLSLISFLHICVNAEASKL